MEKEVGIGSSVIVGVYLGCATVDRNKSRTPFLTYERHRGDEDYTQTFIIKESPRVGVINEISNRSFIGRALIGATVGHEVEVNIGHLGVSQLRPDFVSGSHQKFKIIFIE